MGEFYRDRGDPEVERLAKAICRKIGIDPEKNVRETGYHNAPLIPAWWKHQDFAAHFLACTEAMQFSEDGGDE